MNDETIKKILTDLYALDPSLRAREKDLTTLIRAMAIKPEAQYDPAFAATLRARLLAELSAQPAKRTLADIFMGQSLRYAAAGIAVVAIAVIIGTSVIHPKTGGNTLAFNSATPSITTVAPDAFGTLSALTPSGATNGNTSANTADVQTSGVTAAPMTASAPTAEGTAASGAIAMPIKPVLPPSSNPVTYTYTGSAFSQNQSSLEVLKKVAQPLGAGQATAALEQAGFGQIDLSSFGDLAMNDVTLSQNQSFGYDISLDFADGTISINENYNEWPQGNATPLTASDVPSNTAVIAIANQFLSAHSISTASYGAPQVSPTTIAVPVAMSANAGSAGGSAEMPMIPYYSDSEQVLYPLMVNGQNVYDTNGNAIGMTVTVDVRYKKVSDVYGLDDESYEASAYSAITSTSTILSMAETAQSYPYPIVYNGMESNTSNNATTGNTIDLGTPTLAYEDMYQSDSNGQSTEFLVPAFAFPVVGGTEAGNTDSQIIMVPLISEFAQQNSNPSKVVPVNAPSGVTGSAGTPNAK